MLNIKTLLGLLGAAALALGATGMREAHADGVFVSGAACQGKTNSDRSRIFLGGWGIANDSTSTTMNIQCPIVMTGDTLSGQSRDIYAFRVNYFDQHPGNGTGQRIFCRAQYRGFPVYGTWTTYNSPYRYSNDGESASMWLTSPLNGGNALLPAAHFVLECQLPRRAPTTNNRSWIEGFVVQEQ